MGRRWSDEREDLIATLTVEELRERLLAAEELAVLFGWCAARDKESPRDRLAYEAWSRWHTLVGPDLTGPQANKRIDTDVRVREGRN